MTDDDPAGRHAPTDPTRQPRAGATTWIAVGSTVNGLAAFGFQLVGTRALGPTDYAPIGVLWTLQYLWIAVAVTAVEAYVTRMTTVEGPASPDLHRFLRLFGRWLLLAAAVTMAIGWLLRDAMFDGVGSLAIALGLVVLGYGWYGAVRGREAGTASFLTYSVATAAESGLRLVVAALIVAASATSRALAWAFPVGPFAVIAWAGWWSRRGRRSATDRSGRPAKGEGVIRSDERDTAEAGWADSARSEEAGPAGLAAGSSRPQEVGLTRPTGTGRRFLAAASTANASVQFLLAGGPLVLLPLGADAVAVSVFFTTITAARVPMTFALNGGLSRLLPPLTRLAQTNDTAGIRRASGRLVLAILAVTATAAAGAAAVGPEFIGLLFGEAFRPGRWFVVIVAVGTVLAVGGLLLDQVYIATGREQRLPAVWLPAVVLAGALVLALPGTPSIRVATAFTLATAAAVVALSIPTLHQTRT